MGSYIVHKNGAQLGPFTSEGLRQQLTSGHLAGGDMAWDKARGEWLPVEQLAGDVSGKISGNKRITLIAITLGLILGGGGMLVGWVGLKIIAEVRGFEMERPADEFRQEHSGQKMDFGGPERNRIPEVNRFNPRPMENFQPVVQASLEDLKLLKRRADAGDVNAQFKMGVRHAMGQGVEANEEEAIKWYGMAARQGHRVAMNNLAYTYACRGERLAEALRVIEQAMGARDTPGFMYDTYGWVLFKMGDYRRSLEALETAVRLKLDWETLDHLGDCRNKLRDEEKAHRAWLDAIDLLGISAEPDHQTKLMRIRRKLDEASI